MAIHASLQLYTVDTLLRNDLSGTLAALSEMGLRHVESFEFVDRAADLASALRQHGLTSPTGHAQFLTDRFEIGDEIYIAPIWEKTLEAAATMGIRVLIDPLVPLHRWRTADDIRQTAAQLNSRALDAAAYDIVVGYHNHSQEFITSFDGQSGYELFVSELDPEVVVELDLFWAAIARQDVVRLVSHLGSRLRAVHVKDGVIGEDPFKRDILTLDGIEQRPAGLGEVPISAALAAATALEYAVIEFDVVRGDRLVAISESLAYLRRSGVTT